NSSYTFNIGRVIDLYGIMLHEVGHTLGLAHSLDTTAVMSGSFSGTPVAGLAADDIAGIQAIYGARKPDAYDAQASNDTQATATALTLSSGAVTVNADLTTMADVDYYKVIAPSGTD